MTVMWLIGGLAASLTASPFATVYQWSKVLAGRAGPRPAGAAPRALPLFSRPAQWLSGWLSDNGLEVLSGCCLAASKNMLALR